MSFEEFIATRRFVPCLAVEFRDADEIPGFVYADGFYVELHPDGQHYVLVGNQERVGSLADMERFLWDAFARAEMN